MSTNDETSHASAERAFSSLDLRPARSMGKPLGISKVPGSGDEVRTPGGMILLLGDRLGRGGEGAVYATLTPELVCKIYDPVKLTAGLREKIELMVDRSIDHRSVCWPKSTVVNPTGQFVGYLMPRAAGKTLASRAGGLAKIAANFPSWTRRELVVLAKNVAEAMWAVQKHGILLGDINIQNVLVENENRIFLVDTDSYQIGGFACPVGTEQFLDPDFLARCGGRPWSSVLREHRHESLAVAILMFMILLPGKHPFSYKGGQDPAANMQNGHFPYALGAEKRYDRTPSDEYRNMWSHLPRYLKNLFVWTFDKDKPRRFSTDDWIYYLDRYLYDLEKGHVSDEILPKGDKRLSRYATFRSGGEWVTCDICMHEYGRLPGRPQGCPDCREATVLQNCCLCGQTFHESRHANTRRGKRPPVCLSCLKNMPVQRCVECGQPFEITVGFRILAKQRGLHHPKRCPKCRSARAA